MYCLTKTITQSQTLRSVNILQAVATARNVSMKVVSAPPEKIESYDEKNMRLGRQLSPHLTIYKPQLTSMLSITHRAFGMVLAGYSTALGLGALVSPHDFAHYVTMIEGLQLGGATLTAIKLMIAFPFAYHYVNGVRHLMWDTGKFLKIKEVYSTGYAMVGGSLVLAAILAVI